MESNFRFSLRVIPIKNEWRQSEYLYLNDLPRKMAQTFA